MVHRARGAVASNAALAVPATCSSKAPSAKGETMAKLAICEKCGHTGKGVKQAPGSFAVELVLWVFFCLPGLVYSVWRMASVKRVCAACKGDLVAIESPRGQLLWRTYYQNQLPPKG